MTEHTNKTNRLVLALNKAWLPVDIVSYKDAFRLMAKAHAKALETINESYVMHNFGSWLDLHMNECVEDYGNVNTVSLHIPVPEIIILTEYDKIPMRFVKFNRQNLLIRDDYMCAYCECELDMLNATIDHVIPQAKGGDTSWENCVISCKACNHSKDDKLLHHISETHTLKKKPKEPFHGSPIYQMRRTFTPDEIPDSWKKFLHH